MEVFLPLPSMHLWAPVSLSMLIQIRMKKRIFRDHLIIFFLFALIFNKVKPFTTTIISYLCINIIPKVWDIFTIQSIEFIFDYSNSPKPNKPNQCLQVPIARGSSWLCGPASLRQWWEIFSGECIPIIFHLIFLHISLSSFQLPLLVLAAVSGLEKYSIFKFMDNSIYI